MKHLYKSIPALLLAGIFLFSPAFAEPLESEAPIALHAPTYLLMEADTGTVIFEKNADEQRPVASVTKLMTALLLPAVLAEDVQMPGYLEGFRRIRKQWR